MEMKRWRMGERGLKAKAAGGERERERVTGGLGN